MIGSWSQDGGWSPHERTFWFRKQGHPVATITLWVNADCFGWLIQRDGRNAATIYCSFVGTDITQAARVAWAQAQIFGAIPKDADFQAIEETGQ